MDDKTLIAKRVAMELRPGHLVNLGIGLPTLVASLVPRDACIFFQSENGIVGMQSIPEEGLEAEDLTDAGGSPISALPGAATFDSAMSFGLIRGGHLDVTVLGGLEVDRQGRLANWMVPGSLTLKAHRRQCEELPSLVIVSSRATHGHFRSLAYRENRVANEPFQGTADIAR